MAERHEGLFACGVQWMMREIEISSLWTEDIRFGPRPERQKGHSGLAGIQERYRRPEHIKDASMPL